ncbi:MAG: large subunit ribosomal protein L9 [Paraglaciecola sp.]|jgi:large subunit ribosomal protein L9
MNIILLENVDKVGGQYEVVKVKNGYARNFLIPRSMAIIANDTNMKRLADYEHRQSKKMMRLLGDIKNIAKKLSENTLKIGAKAGTSGKIFGSVTNIQIANALKEQLDMEIDRKVIEIPDVKELGAYVAVIKLHPEVDTRINFNVVQD